MHQSFAAFFSIQIVAANPTQADDIAQRLSSAKSERRGGEPNSTNREARLSRSPEWL
jgi:hypothetical protein